MFAYRQCFLQCYLIQTLVKATKPIQSTFVFAAPEYFDNILKHRIADYKDVLISRLNTDKVGEGFFDYDAEQEATMKDISSMVDYNDLHDMKRQVDMCTKRKSSKKSKKKVKQEIVTLDQESVIWFFDVFCQV